MCYHCQHHIQACGDAFPGEVQQRSVGVWPYAGAAQPVESVGVLGVQANGDGIDGVGEFRDDIFSVVEVCQAVGVQPDIHGRLEFLDPGCHLKNFGEADSGFSVTAEDDLRSVLPPFFLQSLDHLIRGWVTLEPQIMSFDNGVYTSLAEGAGVGAASGYVEVDRIPDRVSQTGRWEVHRQAEKLHGVPCSHPGHIADRESYDSGDVLSHKMDVGRFIALAPEWVRSKVGAIGFHHHTLQRHQ